MDNENSEYKQPHRKATNLTRICVNTTQRQLTMQTTSLRAKNQRSKCRHTVVHNPVTTSPKNRAGHVSNDNCKCDVCLDTFTWSSTLLLSFKAQNLVYDRTSQLLIGSISDRRHGLGTALQFRRMEEFKKTTYNNRNKSSIVYLQ